jgi:hypothetical protein
LSLSAVADPVFVRITQSLMVIKGGRRMAHVARAAGMLPLLGAFAAAAALAGAAVFTVSQAACPNPAHYVREGVSLHVVGGCISHDEVTGATVQQEAGATARSRP